MNTSLLRLPSVRKGPWLGRALPLPRKFLAVVQCWLSGSAGADPQRNSAGGRRGAVHRGPGDCRGLAEETPPPPGSSRTAAAVPGMETLEGPGSPSAEQALKGLFGAERHGLIAGTHSERRCLQLLGLDVGL